jgi:hypothetical protein
MKFQEADLIQNHKYRTTGFTAIDENIKQNKEELLKDKSTLDVVFKDNTYHILRSEPDGPQLIMFSSIGESKYKYLSDFKKRLGRDIGHDPLNPIQIVDLSFDKDKKEIFIHITYGSQNNVFPTALYAIQDEWNWTFPEFNEWKILWKESEVKSKSNEQIKEELLKLDGVLDVVVKEDRAWTFSILRDTRKNLEKVWELQEKIVSLKNCKSYYFEDFKYRWVGKDLESNEITCKVTDVTWDKSSRCPVFHHVFSENKGTKEFRKDWEISFSPWKDNGFCWFHPYGVKCIKEGDVHNSSWREGSAICFGDSFEDFKNRWIGKYGITKIEEINNVVHVYFMAERTPFSREDDEYLRLSNKQLQFHDINKVKSLIGREGIIDITNLDDPKGVIVKVTYPFDFYYEIDLNNLLYREVTEKFGLRIQKVKYNNFAFIKLLIKDFFSLKTGKRIITSVPLMTFSAIILTTLVGFNYDKIPTSLSPKVIHEGVLVRQEWNKHISEWTIPTPFGEFALQSFDKVPEGKTKYVFQDGSSFILDNDQFSGIITKGTKTRLCQGVFGKYYFEVKNDK